LTGARVIAWALLLVGLGLTVLGAALVLNLASLREIVEQTQFHPGIVAVFDLRDEMSHRRAQWLELASGLSGVSVFALAVWLLRRPESR
jgi:hypothetical protein